VTEPPTDADGNAWDADRYERDHAFVYEYGTDVLDLLDPEPGERVLDLGCGTGELTAALDASGVDAVGLDASAEMVAGARDAHPECRFVHADARSFSLDEPFDAAFSNAALHWIPERDHDVVLERVHDALSPEGRFVAELGGVGNVETITSALHEQLRERGYDPESPFYFPSVGEYAPRLEAAGFEVTYATLFDRPTELDGDDGLASWLRMFGDAFFEPLDEPEVDDVVAAVEDAVRDDLYRDGSWTADYRRLRFVAALNA
jgi:trans-aconitate methyltransferase